MFFTSKTFLAKIKKIVKYTFATFFYFSLIFFASARSNDYGSTWKKSGVENFFRDPFITKLTFSKIMRDLEFSRQRAEILHACFYHIDTLIFLGLRLKLEKSWFSAHPNRYSTDPRLSWFGICNSIKRNY